MRRSLLITLTILVAVTAAFLLWPRGARQTVRNVGGAATRDAFQAVTQPATGLGAEWGEAVEGVGMRLRAERTIWRGDEIPALLWDARNDGPRTLLEVPAGQRMAQLEVDGVWYLWPRGLRWAWLPALPPGTFLEDQMLTLSPIWQKADPEELKGLSGGWVVSKQKPAFLQLSPGKHTIRMATIVAKPSQVGAGGVVRRISAPVEITITTPPQGTESKWPADLELADAFIQLLEAAGQVSQEANRNNWEQTALRIRAATDAAESTMPHAKGTPLDPLMQKLVNDLLALQVACQENSGADWRKPLAQVQETCSELTAVFTGDPSQGPRQRQ